MCNLPNIPLFYVDRLIAEGGTAKVYWGVDRRSGYPVAIKELKVKHFKNPAMPSVAVTTDAAIKIASAREGFAQTDTFLEMIGFDQADIRRIKAQEQRVRGARTLEEADV